MKRTPNSGLSPGGDTSLCPRPSHVLELLQRGLAAAESAWFEQHIDACADCYTLLEDLVRIDCEPTDAAPALGTETPPGDT